MSTATAIGTKSGSIVVTKHGAVRGTSDGRVRRYIGVRYAAPPTGERRFALPQFPEPWDDVHDAVQPAATAPQSLREFPQLDLQPLVGRGWVRGDDYLTLNVWTPEDDGTNARPVMVFIHGGAWVVGSKDAAVHDGSAFARSGLVCVAINYRLGVEGFLAIPGAPTNLGLRDQLFALQWVRDNIAAFGGDPGNVTVFGESAGAMSIADLLAAPAARGLFRRAIVQSGHGNMVRSVEVASRLTHKLARMLGVEPDVAGFRSRTVEQCVQAVERVSSPFTRLDLREADGREPAFGLTRFLPVYGDDVLPQRPLDAVAQGAGAAVELLIGTNREEMNLYFVPTGVRRWMFRPLAGWLVRRSEPLAHDVLAAYGMGQGRRTGDAFTEALHDLVFRLPARRFAAAFRGRVHCYEFDWTSPACNGALGACHGVELPFVFDTLECASGAKGIAGPTPPPALAQSVHGLWARFARDGELPWPEYTADQPAVCQLASDAWIAEPPLPAAAFVP